MSTKVIHIHINAVCTPMDDYIGSETPAFEPRVALLNTIGWMEKLWVQIPPGYQVSTVYAHKDLHDSVGQQCCGRSDDHTTPP